MGGRVDEIRNQVAAVLAIQDGTAQRKRSHVRRR
jgi:hypothetical protein